MINLIEQWIDNTNQSFMSERRSCIEFQSIFSGFYSSEFLRESFYVPVHNVPKPDFPALRDMGFAEFLEMPANGITYKDTYYILEDALSTLRIHFHELVHVAQWQLLGSENFIRRYMFEIQSCGYADAPLELMAYELDDYFSSGKKAKDVINVVKQKL